MLLGFLGASAQSVDITCNFVDTNLGYACLVNNAVLTDPSVTVNFVGTHTNNRQNSDVNGTWFQFGNNVQFIPNSLFSTFPNLQALDMEFCGIQVKSFNINIYIFSY